MSRVRKIDIGTVPYSEALELQRSIFSSVQSKEQLSALLLVEHPHVYTLGKSGNAGNLLINGDFLDKINAEYYVTDRGGDITYHGYGQLVGYPILDLDLLGISLRAYIEQLEEVIISTVAHYGIVAGRVSGATGVWIDGDNPHKARKIAAIGVKASRGVTMHGFALNVNTDLTYFNHINPCGMADRGVTSLSSEGIEATFEEVKEQFCREFARIFNVELHPSVVDATLTN